MASAGSGCECSPCGRVLATVTDFDAHQDCGQGSRPSRCLDPASIGLEIDGRGIWGTPAGNASRVRRSARLYHVRWDAPGALAVSPQSASRDPVVVQYTPQPEIASQGDGRDTGRTIPGILA